MTRGKLALLVGGVAVAGAAVAAGLMVRSQRAAAAAAGELQGLGFRVDGPVRDWPDWADRWFGARLPDPPQDWEVVHFHDAEGRPRPAAATERVLGLIARLPGLDRVEVPGLGLGDADVRRLLDSQPRLRVLRVDNNPLTPAVLEAVRRHGALEFVSVDCDGVPPEAVRAASKEPGGACLAAFLSDQDFERFPDQFGSRYLSVDIRGEIVAGLDQYEAGVIAGGLHLGFEPRDGRPIATVQLKAVGPYEAVPLPEPVVRLLEKTPPLDRLEITGFVTPWAELDGVRAGRLTAKASDGLAEFARGAGITSLHVSHATDKRLGSLQGRRLRQLSVEGGRKFTAAFLTDFGPAPAIESLLLRGGGGEPFAADLSGVGPLHELLLDGVPLDGASLRGVRVDPADRVRPESGGRRVQFAGDKFTRVVCGFGGTPVYGPRLELRNMPHLSGADVAALLAKPWGEVHLGVGVAVDATVVAAADANPATWGLTVELAAWPGEVPPDGSKTLPGGTELFIVP